MPDRLRAVFLRRTKLAVHVARLRMWHADLTKLLADDVGMKVDRQVIDRALAIVATELMSNAPAYQCQCGRDPDCRCRGLEWLSQHQAEMETNRDLVLFCEESWTEPPS